MLMGKSDDRALVSAVAATASGSRAEQAPDDTGGVVRVVIGSRVRLYREGLALVLTPEAGIEVVGTAPSPGDILATVVQARPDVVLLDLAMEPDPRVVRDLVHRITSPVVVLGVEGHNEDILAWAESGIAGFVTRDGALSELVATIRSTARGELRCSPAVAYGMLRRLGALASRPDPPPPRAHLTHRELEILDLIDRRLSNKEIAARLGLSVSTVKSHVHNILEKLHVANREEAATLTFRKQRAPREAQAPRPGDLDQGRGSGARD